MGSAHSVSRLPPKGAPLPVRAALGSRRRSTSCHRSLFPFLLVLSYWLHLFLFGGWLGQYKPVMSARLVSLFSFVDVLFLYFSGLFVSCVWAGHFMHLVFWRDLSFTGINTVVLNSLLSAPDSAPTTLNHVTHTLS